jgi:phosphatidylserine decarboxylase
MMRSQPAETANVHQYVCRGDDRVVTEALLNDWAVNFLYARSREHAGTLFRVLTSSRMSKLLAYVNFDLPLAARLVGQQRFLRACGVNLDECVDPPSSFTTPRKIFERKIRYWECRPMPESPHSVVAPADARVLIGSFASGSPLFIKGKFFEFDELLGRNKRAWRRAFAGGDFAVFRLTPDRYHYNHVPVSGEVADVYEIAGRYHACNPGAVVQLVTPYSKNHRVVTIINTDVPAGSNVGLVAMIEVVALMVGDVVQCYSSDDYEYPQPIRAGMFVQRGFPKSLYRPGSSTDVLIFQGERIRFADDLVRNLARAGVRSRFSTGFGQPLVETDVTVRSLIAWSAEEEP